MRKGWLFLANSFFQHKIIHRYTWRRRDEMGEQKSMIGYIALEEKLKKDVLDSKAVRGMFEGSDHYVVLVKIKMKGRWEYGSQNG